MPLLGRGGRPSATPNKQARGLTILPQYEPPSHPLNHEAQRALHDLPRNHKLENLKCKTKAANDHLTQAAADINDRYTFGFERHEKGKKRRETLESPGNSQVNDAGIERMRHDTDEMTGTLDQKVRDIIDARADIESVEKALKELDANVTANRGAIAPTQSTLGASQFRGPKRRRIGVADQEESEDENDSQYLREDDSAANMLKSRITEHRAEYEAESMASRYAAHNDYIGFRKIVHDARNHGDDAPPVPHPSTWFPPEGGSLERAATLRGQDEDEDGFRVASERVSIKCPITLRPMKDPVSSKNCVHNFERAAILEMIGVSDILAGGQRAMKCPVCEKLLTGDDLESNLVLLRKIKRIQAAKDAQKNDSDDDDSHVRDRNEGFDRQEVTSSPAPTLSAIKRERMSQAPGNARRGLSVVPGTQYQDTATENTLDLSREEGDSIDVEDEDNDEEDDD